MDTNQPGLLHDKPMRYIKIKTEKSVRREKKMRTPRESAPEKKSSNLLRRSILTVVMISSFMISLWLPKICLFLEIYAIKTIAYKETTCTLRYSSKSRIIPNTYVPWYFMIVADMCFIGGNLMRIFPEKAPVYLRDNHMFICFSLYVAGLVLFVVHLDLRVIKRQFAQFALSHIAIYFLTLTSSVFITNVNNGKVWFVFPALLIVTNDIFAYIFGKLLGKTPLIKLSPKKTVEGFIGGFVATLGIGLLLAYIKVRTNAFPDKYDNVILQTYTVRLWHLSFPIRYVYIHASMFILFAGLIAPFGGFFASGFKRASKIKDFGESIPGHGGFVDRMDCQFMMGMFTYVYYKTFIKPKSYSVDKIYQIICSNLQRDEIQRLIELLQ